MFKFFRKPKVELDVRFHTDALYSRMTGLIQVSSKKHHLVNEIVPFAIHGAVEDIVSPYFVEQVFLSAKRQGYTPHAIVQMGEVKEAPVSGLGVDINVPRLPVKGLLDNTTEDFFPIAVFNVIDPAHPGHRESFVLETSEFFEEPVLLTPSNITKLFNAVAENRKIPLSLVELITPDINTVNTKLQQLELGKETMAGEAIAKQLDDSDIPAYLRKSPEAALDERFALPIPSNGKEESPVRPNVIRTRAG